MSVDSSLRMKSSLVRHRNVLSRAERVARLRAGERWSSESSPLGLPKVGNRRVKASKKKDAAADATATATPAAGATAAAPAADAKKSDAAKKPASDPKKK